MKGLATRTLLLVVGVLALAYGLAVASATSTQVSKVVPGSITINLLTIQEVADINRDRRVDNQDLMAVARKLSAIAAFDAREDINHDGLVDVLDLAIVAQILGMEVQP